MQKKSNSEIVHPIQLVTSKYTSEKVQDTVIHNINCSFTDSDEEKHDVTIPSLDDTNSDNDSKSNSNSDKENVWKIDLDEFGNNLLTLNRNLYIVVEEFDDILNEMERDIDQSQEDTVIDPLQHVLNHLQLGYDMKHLCFQLNMFVQQTYSKVKKFGCKFLLKHKLMLTKYMKEVIYHNRDVDELLLCLIAKRYKLKIGVVLSKDFGVRQMVSLQNIVI